MPNDIPQEAAGRNTQETGHAPLELPKIVHFDDFARCGDEVWIECGGQLYRLRKTRQGKLILTK
ncbi:MAG: hemin uptake protein HemP [Pirellulaceae bacterium]|nr:hemin uptake protein HemP [Pirellulaceae bacterium]